MGKFTDRPIGLSGRKAEKRTATRVRGRLTIASGSLHGDKGDIYARGRTMEVKSTTKNSMSLKYEWLCKIAEEARRKGNGSSLSIVFVTEDGRPRRDGAWVMVPECDYMKMTSEE